MIYISNHNKETNTNLTVQFHYLFCCSKVSLITFMFFFSKGITEDETDIPIWCKSSIVKY